MSILAPYRQATMAIGTIVLVVVFLTHCVGRQEPEKTIADDWPLYAGTESCAKCHQDIYNQHLNTAHQLSSAPASLAAIKGSFEPGKNAFHFNDGLELIMEAAHDSLYQVAYLNGQEIKRRRFDLVVGSGTKGQSFINRKGDLLFQLPITYFTAADQWTNSPGYPDRPAFDRPITSRCMECHSTYAAVISPEGKEPESFDRNKIIYGISCEKCHGPGAQHVAFQTQHPHDSTAHFIVNPSRLSRQQQIDLCSLCHGGRLQKTKPSFSFRAGDTLSDFFIADSSAKAAADIDVHGNQTGLLASSKCFRQSQMTCSSCHAAHDDQKGQLAVFSQKCISCHQQQTVKACPMVKEHGARLQQDCISCHMPKQPSHAIAVLKEGERTPTPALIRTHYISIYPTESEKILALLRQQKSK
jgi:hypothetical protein